MIWVKPLDKDILAKAAGYDLVITIEDGIKAGGFGDAVASELEKLNYKGKIEKLGIPDKWVGHGSVAKLHELCGINRQNIVRIVKEYMDSSHN